MLRLDGYWTQQSLKVSLTLGEKRAIGRHSSPRWEIDVVAYKGSTNEVLAVECKSFLDSPGVTFDDTGLQPFSRYKMFNEDTTRKVVLSRLERQLVEMGFAAPNPKVRLCLAAGKLRHPQREAKLRSYFDSKGWLLIGPSEIASRLRRCVVAPYENDVAHVVAKLLGRNSEPS